jgi:hypothetical protein
MDGSRKELFSLIDGYHFGGYFSLLQIRRSGPQCCSRDFETNSHTGRPLGAAEFVHALEGSMNRRLAPQKGGRSTKTALDPKQSKLAFEAE